MINWFSFNSKHPKCTSLHLLRSILALIKGVITLLDSRDSPFTLLIISRMGNSLTPLTLWIIWMALILPPWAALLILATRVFQNTLQLDKPNKEQPILQCLTRDHQLRKRCKEMQKDISVEIEILLVRVQFKNNKWKKVRTPSRGHPKLNSKRNLSLLLQIQAMFRLS